MSIMTKTGDDGTTGLMYNRRVPKNHPCVEACGAVDELNAALGLARAAARGDPAKARLLALQRDLVVLMGELATAPEDRARYEQDGYALVTPALAEALERDIRALEARGVSASGWAMPGANPEAAALDAARAVCRRAERRVLALRESGEPPNPQIIVYLNRLSDLLWLLARQAEGE